MNRGKRSRIKRKNTGRKRSVRMRENRSVKEKRSSVKTRRRRRAKTRPKQKKVVRYHKHQLHHINLGMFIFIGIFVYIVFYLSMYFRTTPITGYEVKLGSLAVNTTARGVAVRTEEVYKTTANGYMNYYAREAEKVSNGALVYSVDESGQLSDLLNEANTVSSNFTDNDMTELRKEIENHQKNFDDSDFRSVYDFKYSLNGLVARLKNANVMAVLQTLSGNEAMSRAVAMGYTSNSGIVVYGTDGLENLSPSEVNKDTFDEEKHQRTIHDEHSVVTEGEDAYKLVTEENWSIVVPFNDDWEDKLKDGDYVNVRFLKNNLTSWAKMTFLTNEDGRYLQLSFTNSMLTFATDRYIDVELLTDTTTGLKIPNSSIVMREFYLIPEEFVTKGGDSDADGFMRETYLENGSKSVEFVEADVYDKKDGQVYIDTSIFNSGDVLLKPDSEETFTVSTKDKLRGVYNMNNGYADFAKVDVKCSNKEYAIVESGTAYGLRVYDHIVLDGESVNDDDLVFEQMR